MASSKDKPVLPSFPSFTKTWHNSTYAAIAPTRPELSAAGKHVVVTGGGTGIGRASALAFAQANAASVTILGRREDRLQSAKATILAAVSGADISYHVADLTIRSTVDDTMKLVASKVGKIDILVSNAGFSPKPEKATTTNVETFMSAFEANVRGALNAVQAFLLYAAPSAVLLSTSSGVAHTAPFIPVAYATSKAANLKMMDFFAAENPGLHVVSVQPGTIATEMTEYWCPRGAG